MMTELIKIIGLMGLSSVKFFFAPSTTLIAGYSFLETLAITISGGIIGIIVFFYFGEFMKALYAKMRPNKSEKKKFSKTSRRIVTIKGKYGLIGLAILTPIMISIPIGSLIAARYFDHDKKTIPYLLISVIGWSIILTSISSLIGNYI